ncbi:uncharacterized protein PRCAT00002416001 [Priceomyces carsonii]|uniref:uncharacterized protein n=1 Tax=Priceomyces carsonii TaxID=28549 RepID=UPI002ED7B061|nr:unnamed protein product [Priceomyces carsonii]
MSNPTLPKTEDMSHLSSNSSNQSGSNDFVKKLFQMLKEDTYKDIVRWTTNGDSFVVLNTNEFTKDILPRHFKHSNFASFVRQLNKYDFHKVKIPNEEKQSYQYGEDAWEFRHPDFRINDQESLENIKRKGPGSKKGVGTSDHGSNMTSYTTAQIHHMNESIELLKAENKQLHQDMSILQGKYKTLIENIVSLNNVDERYHRYLNVLATCLAHAGIKVPPLDFPNPNLVNLQQPPLSHSTAANTQPPQPPSTTLNHQMSPPLAGAHPNNNSMPLNAFDQQFMSQPLQPPLHLQARTPLSGEGLAAKSQSSPQITTAASESPALGSNLNTTDSHRRLSRDAPSEIVTTTNIPNPKFHVLLVEDDNVCIQLCRKFLVKYGCQVTVVTDGLNAISTLEHTKYDLVLMDIVMPNLDGATATSVIRSFDTRTPIIAMTGNIEDNDLVTYLQNGMSDILAKPFTKDDLYSILSKHLLETGQKNDISQLQGPPQETLALPQEQQRQAQQASQQGPPQTSNIASSIGQTSGPNGEDQMLKKQRLS